MFKCASALALGVVVAAGSIGMANAATVTFELQKPGSYVDGNPTANLTPGGPLTLEAGGLTAVFSGHVISGESLDTNGVISGASVGNAVDIFRYNNGLGVQGGSGDGEHSIDDKTGTNDLTEFVQMSFSDGSGDVNVQLTQLVFGWVGGPDTGFTQCQGGPECYTGVGGAFELIVDTDGSGAIGNADTRVVEDSVAGNDNGNDQDGYSADAFSFTGAPIIDSVFGIKAGDDGLPGAWKLRAVTVETIMAPPPPPIPLPAAGWLLLAGIGGLAALRRRA